MDYRRASVAIAEGERATAQIVPTIQELISWL
jgi:hypothetical protein